MIDKLPDIIRAGVTSLKIEGRIKSMYYVATIISAYRNALDDYLSSPENYSFDPAYLEELEKVSHRDFTKGFYYNKPTEEDQNYITSDYTRNYSFVGIVTGYEEETGLTLVEQRNKFSKNDIVEIFGPGQKFYEEKIEEMYDEEGNPIESAPHPQQKLKIKFKKNPSVDFIIRKKK